MQQNTKGRPTHSSQWENRAHYYVTQPGYLEFLKDYEQRRWRLVSSETTEDDRALMPMSWHWSMVR